MSCFIESKKDLSISVFDTEEVENVTLYKIKVQVFLSFLKSILFYNYIKNEGMCFQIGNVNWNVVHRYRDFSALHSKLISDHGVPTCKDLLPPKKAIRNKTPKFVEQRKEKLDAYLKQIYSYLELTMPRDFTEFLDFQTYDILFILQNLALKFYHEGDQLLLKPQPYIFTPLEVNIFFFNL